MLVCDSNKTFKEREFKIKNVINLLNEINQNNFNNNFTIDNLILIDCLRDARSGDTYMFNNITFNIKTKEFNSLENSKSFITYLNDFQSLYLNRSVESLSKCILIVNENYLDLLKSDIMYNGFNLWNTNNQQLIVGTESLVYQRTKNCHKIMFQNNVSKEKSHFVSFNYAFIHKYVLELNNLIY